MTHSVVTVHCLEGKSARRGAEPLAAAKSELPGQAASHLVAMFCVRNAKDFEDESSILRTNRISSSKRHRCGCQTLCWSITYGLSDLKTRKHCLPSSDTLFSRGKQWHTDVSFAV